MEMKKLFILSMLLMVFCSYAHGKNTEEGSEPGSVKTYYENGEIESETLYRDSQIIESKHYFEKGVLALESYFRNGYDDMECAPKVGHRSVKGLYRIGPGV